MIELLIVIAIIGILMALLFPAVGGVMETAKKAKAKNDVVQLAVAVKTYQAEYGRSPVNPTGVGEHSDGWFQGAESGSHQNKDIVRILMGEKLQRFESPKNCFPGGGGGNGRG